MKLLLSILAIVNFCGCANHGAKNPFGEPTKYVVQEIACAVDYGYWTPQGISRADCRAVDLTVESLNKSEYDMSLRIISETGDFDILGDGRVFMSAASIKTMRYSPCTFHIFVLLPEENLPRLKLKLRNFMSIFHCEFVGPPVPWK